MQVDEEMDDGQRCVGEIVVVLFVVRRALRGFCCAPFPALLPQPKKEDVLNMSALYLSKLYCHNRSPFKFIPRAPPNRFRGTRNSRLTERARSPAHSRTIVFYTIGQSSKSRK